MLLPQFTRGHFSLKCLSRRKCGTIRYVAPYARADTIRPWATGACSKSISVAFCTCRVPGGEIGAIASINTGPIRGLHYD